jgi:hypothetical protein
MAWDDSESDMATYGTDSGARWAAIERERMQREERTRRQAMGGEPDDGPDIGGESGTA